MKDDVVYKFFLKFLFNATILGGWVRLGFAVLDLARQGLHLLVLSSLLLLLLALFLRQL